MEEEQVYTIPLRETHKAKRNKRAAKAVKIVKKFLKRHMNADEVKIDSDLNQKIWNQGVEKPPPKIRVRAVKRSDNVVEASSLE